MSFSPALRVTEIFYSLQGETRTVGIPTVFIRLTGCPLRCRYCDTKYAFKGGKRTSFVNILAKVQEYSCKMVTVTGGEPLAQKACIPFLSMLCDEGYSISLETSGALDIWEVDKRVVKVMDLKTPSSGEVHRNLWENLDHLQRHDQVKFVIGNREDYEWAKERINEHQLFEKCEILFSPQTSLQERVSALRALAWQSNPGLSISGLLRPSGPRNDGDKVCCIGMGASELADWILEDKLSVRFQIQLHKVLWGDIPGK